VQVPPRHREECNEEAIQSFFAALDCFAIARNDAGIQYDLGHKPSSFKQ